MRGSHVAARKAFRGAGARCGRARPLAPALWRWAGCAPSVCASGPPSARCGRSSRHRVRRLGHEGGRRRRREGAATRRAQTVARWVVGARAEPLEESVDASPHGGMVDAEGPCFFRPLVAAPCDDHVGRVRGGASPRGGEGSRGRGTALAGGPRARPRPQPVERGGAAAPRHAARPRCRRPPPHGRRRQHLAGRRRRLARRRRLSAPPHDSRGARRRGRSLGRHRPRGAAAAPRAGGAVQP